MASVIPWSCALLVVVGAACSSSSAEDGARDGGGDAALDAGAADGAPLDGGNHADAGPGADAAADAGPHGCAGTSHKLCEDFDSAPLNATPTGWTVLNGYGASPPSTVVASDEFHSPPHAIKTASSVAGASRLQRSLAALGATAGTHWGRVFFKVKSPAPQLTSQGPHATFVALQGNLRARELRVVDTQQATTGKIQLLANTPDDQCCTGTGFDYEIWDGAWHCSEWYVDQATQSYRSFLDGVEVKALAFQYGAGSTKANMPPAFSAVAVGTIFYTPTLPSDLVTWFDDLAIDDTQIGCGGT
ncbi:MAG: hypothetical protein JWP97_787 [Labilithrix sp.]|nr:hypothetical protein [Labilithrix sp.]